MRGVNDDEIADFVELTRDSPINVRFIEYMPFDGNAWGSNKMVPYRELMQAVNSRWEIVCRVVPYASLRRATSKHFAAARLFVLARLQCRVYQGTAANMV
jgi:molybdenum cofactor biosynthesis enzyme MoaA